jgi:hypothetical protein
LESKVDDVNQLEKAPDAQPDAEQELEEEDVEEDPA